MTVETKITPTETPLEAGGLEELHDQIHALGPLLRENAAIADVERRLPHSSIDALAGTGAFSLLIHTKYGGLSGGAEDLVKVARTIGRYDPAASWVTVISNGSAMLAQRFPETAVARVFEKGPARMS